MAKKISLRNIEQVFNDIIGSKMDENNWSDRFDSKFQEAAEHCLPFYILVTAIFYSMPDKISLSKRDYEALSKVQETLIKKSANNHSKIFLQLLRQINIENMRECTKDTFFRNGSDFVQRDSKTHDHSQAFMKNGIDVRGNSTPNNFVIKFSGDSGNAKMRCGLNVNKNDESKLVLNFCNIIRKSNKKEM